MRTIAASPPLNVALRGAQPQGPQEEEPEGVEMEADFDGELHDVPEDPAADDAEPEEGDDDRLEQVCISCPHGWRSALGSEAESRRQASSFS